MTDSIRQQIITKIDTRFKAILKTNGYETDLGLNVHAWLGEGIDQDNLPVLDYKDEAVVTNVETLSPGFDHEMEMTIRVVAQDDTPMAVIRQMIADIDKAVGVDDTWDHLALWTKRIGDQSGVQIGDLTFAGCTIKMIVIFRTLGWDDYTKL